MLAIPVGEVPVNVPSTPLGAGNTQHPSLSCMFCKIRGAVLSVAVTGELCCRLLFLGLHEGVRDLLASVLGRDQNEKGTACDEETEIAAAGVAFVVCVTHAFSEKESLVGDFELAYRV